jgi:hypothetical protein
MLLADLGHLFDPALRLTPDRPAVFRADTAVTGAGLGEACAGPAPRGVEGEVPVAFVVEREGP